MKIITFSTGEKPKQEEIKFEEKTLDGGVTIKYASVPMMLASSKNTGNRNKFFFQIAQLLGYRDRLDKIMFNFNHDLTLSGGKYLGNNNRFVDIWTNNAGSELEVWALFETSDPVVIEKLSEITAPSIELMVDSIYQFKSGDGFYADNIDFFGCALLLGVKAGMSEARLDLKNLYKFHNIEEEEEREEEEEEQTAKMIQSLKNDIKELRFSLEEKIKNEDDKVIETTFKRLEEVKVNLGEVPRLKSEGKLPEKTTNYNLKEQVRNLFI